MPPRKKTRPDEDHDRIVCVQIDWNETKTFLTKKQMEKAYETYRTELGILTMEHAHTYLHRVVEHGMDKKYIEMMGLEFNNRMSGIFAGTPCGNQVILGPAWITKEGERGLLTFTQKDLDLLEQVGDDE